MLDLTGRHTGKRGLNHGFKLVKRLASKHDKAHVVGGVISLVEIKEVIQYRRVRPIRQTFQRADRELAVRMIFVHKRLQHIQPPSTIAFKPHLILGLHRIHFSVDVLFIQIWRHKELGESIQSFWQVTDVDIKKVIRVIERSIGVSIATVFSNVLLVLGRIRVLLCTQEQHMLQEVRKPSTTVRVITAANINVECSSRFLC